MKNKQIALYSVLSVVIFVISLAMGADSSYADGFTKFIYFASVVAMYTFIIWGWIRLFKSDK